MPVIQVALLAGAMTLPAAAQATTPDVASPGARTGALMVYDAGRRQVVLFGGVRPGPSGQGHEYPNDLWAWNGKAWHELRSAAQSGRPPGRDVPHLTYDVSRKRVVLLGGRRESAGGPVELLDDVWEWDGARWHEIAHAGLPKLLHAACAYDSVHRRVVMHGGLGDAGFSRALWEWDGARWTVRASNGPAGVYVGGYAFSPEHEWLLPSASSLADTDPVPPPATHLWKWNGATWSEGEPVPPFANLQAIAGAPDGTLYFYQSWDRWLSAPIMHVRDPNGQWRQVPMMTHPGMRGTLAAAYDAARRRFVIYGGRSREGEYLTDTWEFDGRGWMRKQPR